MFLYGFFCGFALCLFICWLALEVVKMIFNKYGKLVVSSADKVISKMADVSVNGAEIIYEDQSKEIFKSEGTSIDDLLKN